MVACVEGALLLGRCFRPRPAGEWGSYAGWGLVCLLRSGRVALIKNKTRQVG